MQRSFGFWTSVSMVVGTMIGAGIFALPSSLASFGWTSAIGWVVAGLGAMSIARVIAQLTLDRPQEPSIMTISGDVLGLLPGRMIAWSYWIALIGAAAVLSVVAASYLLYLLPGSSAGGFVQSLLAFGILAAIAILNVRGVRSAGRFQVVTTFLKLLPLAFVIAIILFLALTAPETYTASNSRPVALEFLTPAIGVTFYAMLGFESASMITERVRDPERNVVRATLFGLGLVFAIYFIVSTGIVLATPAAELRLSSAPLASFASVHAGPLAGDCVALFAAISAIGCLNAVILLTGEIPFGMARDGQLPEWMAPVSQTDIGLRPLLTGTGVAGVLVLASSNALGEQVLDFLLRLTAASAVWFYAGICAAAIMANAQRVLAILGLGFCGWVLYGTGAEASLFGIGLMLIGVVLHFLIGGRTRPRGSFPAN